MLLHAPFILLLLLPFVSSTLSKRDKRSICYGYTHRLRSYDVTLDSETDVAELRCCHDRSIMNLARWRVSGPRGTSDHLPYCSTNGDVDFACWKYVSRLSVRLFVNVTQLREVGEATFLCGTEPMSDTEFTLTTKVHVTSPRLPTPTPVEEMKPQLPDTLGGSSCNLSDHLVNDIDSQCERKKIVMCFGNVSSLIWTFGRQNHPRRVAQCTNVKCPVDSCWKVSENEDGLELHLSRERRRSKKAFRCDGDVSGLPLCVFKALWD